MMMMIREAPSTQNPTIQVPIWNPYDDPTAVKSPCFPVVSPSIHFDSNANGIDYLMALYRFLPSNEFISTQDSDTLNDVDSDLPVDVFSCDYFRIYEFKVRKCVRGRSHDWTECPYVHPGEKARRRDPRKYNYSGIQCPEYRKGDCRKGDSCEFAHGVFECWLHPARYRTQPCKDGPDCCRRVCFFAHTTEQLRVLPQHSPRGNAKGTSDFERAIRRRSDFDSYAGGGLLVSSPTSGLASPPVGSPSDSPPTSPSCDGSLSSAGELMSSMHGLQFGKMKTSSGTTRGLQMGSWFDSATVIGSPRRSMIKPGFCSLPSTPAARNNAWSGLCQVDLRETPCTESTMGRVASGRDLRAKMYAKLSKENSLGRVDATASAPDVGWVSELVN